MSSDDGDAKTTRITRKGQVTIPKRLREKYGLEVGDEILWEQTEDGLRVTKATLSAGRGMLVADDVPAAKREEMAEELESEIHERRRNEWAP